MSTYFEVFSLDHYREFLCNSERITFCPQVFCLLEINTGPFNEAIENKAVERNFKRALMEVTYSNGNEQVLLIVITLLYTNTDFVVFIKVV
jgi:hypothetical protein